MLILLLLPSTVFSMMQPSRPPLPSLDILLDSELNKLSAIFSDCQTVINLYKQLKSVKTIQDYGKLVQNCGILKVGVVLEPLLLNVTVNLPDVNFVFNPALPTKDQFEKLLKFNVKAPLDQTLWLTRKILNLTLMALEQAILKLLKQHQTVSATVFIPDNTHLITNFKSLPSVSQVDVIPFHKANFESLGASLLQASFKGTLVNTDAVADVSIPTLLKKIIAKLQLC